jgi:hypothetical protein
MADNVNVDLRGTDAAARRVGAGARPVEAIAVARRHRKAIR